MKWIYTLALVTAFFAGCTKQLDGSLRNSPVSESSSAVDVNTKVDLLFVVDNSQSMDPVQKKMRTALQSFAQTYLKATWDIQVGVITTDAYIANSKFSDYLARPIHTFSGANPTSKIVGKYYSQIQASVDPTESARKAQIDALINLGASDIANADPTLRYAKYTDSFTYNTLVQAWGPDYAKLVAGVRDGPIAGFCSEQLPYFSAPDKAGNAIVGPKCQIRDQSTTYVTQNDCLNATGDDDIHQCLNTYLNDTVHSGKAILTTQVGNGYTEAQWIDQLIKDFKINVTTGSAGSGSERGLQSISQFLADNEGYQGTPAASQFFRAGSTRAVIIISDEDDQSIEIPNAPSATFQPFTDYQCDLKVLVEKNLYRYPIDNVTIHNTAEQYQATVDLISGKYSGGAYTGTFYCCPSGRTGNGANDPDMACTFTDPTNVNTVITQASDLSYVCPRNTLGATTFGVSLCPDSSKLIPVSTFKNELDAFFTALDGDATTGKSSYFVAAIIPNSSSTYSDLDSSRVLDDDRVNVSVTKAPVDSGERYRVLVNAVAQGSMILDLGSNDYSALLSQIGGQIVARKGKFTLRRAPTSADNMIVKVVNSNGQTTVLNSNQFQVSGRVLTITDASIVLGLGIGSRVLSSYDPQQSYD